MKRTIAVILGGLGAVLAVLWMTGAFERPAPPPPAPGVPVSPGLRVPVLAGAAGDLEVLLRPLHGDPDRQRFAEGVLREALGLDRNLGIAMLWIVHHGAEPRPIEPDLVGRLRRPGDPAWRAATPAAAASRAPSRALEAQLGAWSQGDLTALPAGTLLRLIVAIPAAPGLDRLDTLRLETKEPIVLLAGEVPLGELQRWELEPEGRIGGLLRPRNDDVRVESSGRVARQDGD